jgi:sirohydrochlorin cobaltochelatase
MILRAEEDIPPARIIAPAGAIVGPQLPARDKCLILLAHGSKDPRWCAPFERIARESEKRLGKQKIRLAYMEFVGPTLMEVVSECVQQMTLDLRLLPLFMSVGAHLATDIPEQVSLIRLRFPQITLEVLAPIGEDARMIRLVEQIAIEAAGKF